MLLTTFTVLCTRPLELIYPRVKSLYPQTTLPQSPHPPQDVSFAQARGDRMGASKRNFLYTGA